jgi:hypothetical protein
MVRTMICVLKKIPKIRNKTQDRIFSSLSTIVLPTEANKKNKSASDQTALHWDQERLFY